MCFFTFPDFMSSHAIQSSDTPCSLPYFLRGCVCVRVTERDLVNLCVRLSLHCFVFFPCFSLFMCVCVLIFDRLDNYGVTALQEHRTLEMKHKQPLNGEIHYSMLPTCIGIQAVPVLMHNHVKKKNFLSHIHSTYGHTYSLM